MMGKPRGRVNIMQWRAAFQHDLDQGRPTAALTRTRVDVYPDEVLGAADARPYRGAVGIDNPISRGGHTVPGPDGGRLGSMTVMPDQHALGNGVWMNGGWRVVITRPMARTTSSPAPQARKPDPGCVRGLGWRQSGGRSAQGVGHLGAAGDPAMSAAERPVQERLERASLYRLLGGALARPQAERLAELAAAAEALAPAVEPAVAEPLARFAAIARETDAAVVGDEYVFLFDRGAKVPPYARRLGKMRRSSRARRPCWPTWPASTRRSGSCPGRPSPTWRITSRPSASS